MDLDLHRLLRFEEKSFIKALSCYNSSQFIRHSIKHFKMNKTFLQPFIDLIHSIFKTNTRLMLFKGMNINKHNINHDNRKLKTSSQLIYSIIIIIM